MCSRRARRLRRPSDGAGGRAGGSAGRQGAAGAAAPGRKGARRHAGCRRARVGRTHVAARVSRRPSGPRVRADADVLRGLQQRQRGLLAGIRVRSHGARRSGLSSGVPHAGPTRAGRPVRRSVHGGRLADLVARRGGRRPRAAGSHRASLRARRRLLDVRRVRLRCRGAVGRSGRARDRHALGEAWTTGSRTTCRSGSIWTESCSPSPGLACRFATWRRPSRWGRSIKRKRASWRPAGRASARACRSRGA